MKEKRRIIIGAAVILLLALAIWLTVEFSPRSFAAITGLDKEKIEYVWTYDSEGHRTEDVEDINSLVDHLSSYRYQRVRASSFDFVKEFPDGLAAFSIFIHVGDKEFTFVEPLASWANIDNKIYRVVDGPLDMDWLWQWLAGLPLDRSGEPELLPVGENVCFRAGKETDGELLLATEMISGCHLEADDGVEAQITLVMTPEGASQLERVTSERIGETISIWAGERRVASPRVLEPISGGKCTFNQNPDQAEATLALLTAD